MHVLFQQIEVKMYEKPGINFLEVTGSLAEKDLANAVTKSRAEKEVWQVYTVYCEEMFWAFIGIVAASIV